MSWVFWSSYVKVPNIRGLCFDGNNKITILPQVNLALPLLMFSVPTKGPSFVITIRINLFFLGISIECYCFEIAYSGLELIEVYMLLDSGGGQAFLVSVIYNDV